MVDNPSAGTIIDALAIPVGDGLAGHAGGKIGNKINVKILSSQREVKLAQMDGAATSGEALKLGRKINSITAKINELENSTPQFLDKSKTGTDASKTASSNKITIEKLSIQRELKLDQLESAPTEGVRLILGREINTITAEMNKLEKSTPQFYDKSTIETTASKTAPSNVTIPVTIYDDAENQKEENIEGLV